MRRRFIVAVSSALLLAGGARAAEMPGDAYLQYMKVLHAAKDLSELKPYASKSQRERWDDPQLMRSMLQQLMQIREFGPADVAVVYQKPTGDWAVVEASGRFKEQDAKGELRQWTRWACVKMHKVDGRWEILNEYWFDHPLNLGPNWDPGTAARCAQAATAQISNAPAKGKLWHHEYEATNALFHPRAHCLTLYLHETANPPRHARITIQYPDAVTELTQISVRRPGNAQAGLKIGIEIDEGANKMSNVYDNDNVYGLKVQYAPEADGKPACLVDLRLPDTSISSVAGRVPIEVKP